MIEPTEIDKLRMLIPHWIEHIEGHAAEFRRWVAKAVQAKVDILAAAEAMDAVNDVLERAIKRLGGPLGIGGMSPQR